MTGSNPLLRDNTKNMELRPGFCQSHPDLAFAKYERKVTQVKMSHVPHLHHPCLKRIIRLHSQKTKVLVANAWNITDDISYTREIANVQYMSIGSKCAKYANSKF